jgi:hypothetical protein
MDVKIDADAMTAVVSRAILEGISTEQRDLLLEQAVTALVTPVKKDRYSLDPATTPLQEAFRLAAQRVVNQVATEMVEANPEFVAKVHEMVGEVIVKAAEEDYGLKSKIQYAVAEALISWKHDR